MIRIAALLCATAAIGACATMNNAPGPGGTQPADIVAARQAAFSMSAATLGALRAGARGGGDVKPLVNGARALARWARAMPGMFPESSRGLSPGAKPVIWTNMADFRAKAADYAAAATRLSELAQAGDAGAFNVQLAVVAKSCGACHDVYRNEEHR
jgi:cytochrome c556